MLSAYGFCLCKAVYLLFKEALLMLRLCKCGCGSCQLSTWIQYYRLCEELRINIFILFCPSFWRNSVVARVGEEGSSQTGCPSPSAWSETRIISIIHLFSFPIKKKPQIKFSYLTRTTIKNIRHNFLEKIIIIIIIIQHYLSQRFGNTHNINYLY